MRHGPARLPLRRRLPGSPLGRYMTAVTLVGLPVWVWTCLDLVHTVVQLDVTLLAVLVAGLVVGELMPISISRQGRSSDEVTISTTFALALLIVAPLGVVVLAQSIPLVLDDVRRGKHWSRPLFNLAQYTLTFSAARATYCLLTGQDLLVPAGMQREDLLPAFVAGAVFFAVNHGSVGTAVALWAQERVLPHLLEDIRFQLSTGGLLVLLSPLVVVSSSFSLALVPVLLLPIAAVRRSAQLASAREHDALHDVLTGLPNRARLHVELRRALGECQRSGTGLVVVLADLDHFKEINDTLGHHVGDLLITDVARRLTAAAGEDVLVARLGGDEFAVLAAPPGPAADVRAAAMELVARLSWAMREPVTLAGVRLDVQASFGIALAPEHGLDIEELIARADVAMYAAKEDRGTWATYDPDLDEHTPQRLAMLAELRDGLGRGELVLHYQPKCEARSGEVVGVEALVRWQHPTRGLLMPDEFIPGAEGTGIIAALTLTVLDTALRDAALLAAQGQRLGVAVNLSVRHLTDLELPRQVAAALARHGVPAELLTLEVTESTIMNDPSRAVTVLGRLRTLGVRIAVDDYGTGYSSLAYLKRLAIDELKIDKSFVTGMLDDENDAVIVRSTIELGHNLGLQLVAEGVEDAATWQLLLPLGCDVLQGYCISAPLPLPALVAWLGRWQDTIAAGLPSGALPSGALPSGAVPSGAVSSGAVPRQAGARPVQPAAQATAGAGPAPLEAAAAQRLAGHQCAGGSAC